MMNDSLVSALRCRNAKKLPLSSPWFPASVLKSHLPFPMHQTSILLIGDLDRLEFEGVREFLKSFGQIYHFLDAETASDVLAKREMVPDLTIIAQSFPGEFSQQVVDRLREATPLSRMLALLGSWCEGEMRSGQPWPTVIRAY
jgi:hypothetical protein